ncbi:MAG: MBL fold metallo-hydrolase [Saprospiraceae bacterium]|nr:MBL fold metallo-hydrolase [Saprospiraceae bacterium]
MKITFWGTRGSLPASGPETQYYGGNTSCITVSNDKHLLVLDAGSGIRRVGLSGIPFRYERIDILLTHLHMDHIQGLGFFAPLYQPGAEVHVWGPASYNSDLPSRLTRYLSPPLFPVRIRELPSNIEFHEVGCQEFEIGDFHITSRYVCHPGPTVGYRITHGKSVFTYIPDHEPALGDDNFPISEEWTSGFDLAKGADILVHDAQFSNEEYQARVGWGHSTFEHALAFAKICEVKRLLLFHHDPSHTDRDLERFYSEYVGSNHRAFEVRLSRENDTFLLSGD